MTNAKALLDFIAQSFIVGYFAFRLWIWRASPKGRAVLAEVPAMMAFCLLMLLLFAFLIAIVWFDLLPALGVQP
jgi:hypothetical protein